MLRALVLASLLLSPLPLTAQEFGCPADVHQQVYDLTAKVVDGTVATGELGSAATDFFRACGDDRPLPGQILAMFTAAGLAIEPPDPARFSAHLNAFRTIRLINRFGGSGFDPVTLAAGGGAQVDWTVFDERNAYWDLLFAMSSDFLVYGVHAELYTPGTIEQVGCGPYPAEEASALARHASENVDGGELVARVAFLGQKCDTDARETSGYAALYFAEHARARAADEGYVGLTLADIQRGIGSFLDQHLGGETESALFTADEVAELRGY